MSLAYRNLSRYRAAARFKLAAKVIIPSSFIAVVLGGVLVFQNIHSKVEQTISNSLGRTVHLGELRGISHRGVWLGQTDIPPAVDKALAGQIEAVVVGLDWLALRQRRNLRAVVTLVRPNFLLALPGEAAGLPTYEAGSGAIAAPESTFAALSRLRINGGSLTLQAPFDTDSTPARPAITLHQVQATVHRPDHRPDHWPGHRPDHRPDQHPEAQSPLTFTLAGQLGSGSIQTSGTVDGARRSLRMTAQTHNLPLDGLNLGLSPAISIQAGTLDSTLTLTGPLSSALSPTAWQLVGIAMVRSVEGQLKQLPAPIDHLQSTLAFGGQRVTLTDTRLQIGPLTLDAAGTLDRQTGYDLTAQARSIMAADLRTLVGDRIPLTDSPWQGNARLTGPLQEPLVDLQPDLALAPPGQFVLDLGGLGLALGLQAQALPSRDWIGPIEGATYQFGNDGAWFTLTDGTVVPPLSEGAYQSARASLGPALDRKFFWLLQTNPYVTAIAADLAKGKLEPYRQGRRFNTDRFFREYFAPIYAESSRAAGLDPGEALWMLDHSLRTLHDPLLRHPDARPIASGAGIVGSFWADEQQLSMQQLLARPLLAQPGIVGQWARWAVLKQLDAPTAPDRRRLSSTPELMAKIPNVTVGAEEGAIALALGIMRFQGEGIYPEALRSLAAAIEQNERDKSALRATMTDRMVRLAADHTNILSFALLQFTDRDWATVGMGKHLFPGGAAHLNGGNTLSVMVSRQEKAGYSLEQAYENSRLLLLDLLSGVDGYSGGDSGGDRILFAVLKDHALTPRFWSLLAQKEPTLAPALGAIAADAVTYRHLAQQGATLHEAFYAQLVEAEADIGVSAAIKQAVGFQAHLATLIDQTFAPADPGDPRYRVFRRSIAIYLREAPDISVYGGTEASLRAYGLETLNVQELIAVDRADAPRLRAMVRLYQAALAQGLITEWDVPGLQRILLAGALLAAGVERPELPANLRQVGFPSAQFRRDLLFVVGVEGIHLEATRLGVQAHDHRVGFQPIALPAYRPPALTVADPLSCPSRPQVRAIALGAAASFAWDAATQRVVLRRGSVPCPLPDDWATLFFPALLEAVPIKHSEKGRDYLQQKLREAQRLEAGIF